ncbi:MAG: hypothetical protein F6K54_19335 [Okeania sp. SIO3B5]|uniref:hypothetical protein n=1 Tax=Okeania sp. SIO3B5 TaxID=2607811 RepID=UPI00140127D9|nr:hypothetical protein [Okeania sp. SIO3B5]NEO55039.1 hypothetical protein [Okeania sp. SIO3B5]
MSRFLEGETSHANIQQTNSVLDMAKYHSSLTGIEAKIEYHPAFEELGELYEC